ncbi:uncharacterized protein LOC117320952 [Pecten maximus]|uniref:uncharacterized protein LOC117320952 n=1 Tax=Pecten maximus TaxID=6579 RepID=UPI001458D6C2|nr:uncharacterized protein LOC117320952 [Pecten maximus]
MSSRIQELKELAASLGLEGKEIMQYIVSEQAAERDERARERERQHDLEMARERLKVAEAEASLQEQRAVQEHKRQMELLAKQSELGPIQIGAEAKPASFVKAPKLPYFDDGKDNIDSYLQRFDRYATTQKWNKETQWATHLSVLLKGRALDVFSRMPLAESMDYDQLKRALLKRFEMTEQGFRKRFRGGRPESGETFAQFAVRLESYFMRWIELAGVKETFADLRDLMLRDQFIQTCGNELMLFLKERTPSSIAEMSKLADQYADARGNPSSLAKPRPDRQKRTSDGNGPKANQQGSVVNSDKVPIDKDGQSKRRTCFICNSPDHLAFKCPQKKKNQVKSVSRDMSTTEDGPTVAMRLTQMF